MNGKISVFLMIAVGLFVALTTNVAGQPVKPIKTNHTYYVTGSIKWSKTYGIIPIGPGYNQATSKPCDPFFVAATVPATGKAVVTATVLTLDPYYDPNYYVCKYRLKVPPSTPLYMIAGMGGILLLPEMSHDHLYWTDAWVGGNYNKPPSRATRTFTGSQSINVGPNKPTFVVNFEMVYARPDNPK